MIFDIVISDLRLALAPPCTDFSFKATKNPCSNHGPVTQEMRSRHRSMKNGSRRTIFPSLLNTKRVLENCPRIVEEGT